MDSVNRIVMGVIVLQKPLRAAIEDLDLLVGSAGSNACAVWVELDVIDHASVVRELLDLLSSV
jgi:hypothetical protein